ncbi:hypothetical protein SK128_005731 [Halocaridina rubra]|uniref:SET domain-containing protein n=1 Tax=Halocaridina rubra TaxID=373956 RepID=A0AAN8XF99_HALRR
MECTMQNRMPILERYLDSLAATNPSWYSSSVHGKVNHINTFCDLLSQDYRTTKDAEIHRCHEYEDSLFHEDSTLQEQRPIHISYSPVYGRYLAAFRDIKAGELIFQERPLVLAPKAGSGPTCLACLKALGNDWNGCQTCGAPLCTPPCTGESHTERECSVISRLGLKGTKNLPLVKMLNVILTPLRTLMLTQEDTSAGEVIAALQSNMEKRKKLPIGRFIQEQIVGIFRSRMGLDIDSDIVHHICGVFDTNAFEVSLNDTCRGRALFPLGALMNHSCSPNTQHWFNNGIMTVRAVTNIEVGEPVTNTYTPVLLGTRGRTAHLLATKLFKCMCKRCRDPTELGSHISSIVCRECNVKKGLMVPPGDIGDNWICQECGNQVSNTAIETLVRAASAATSRMASDDTETLVDTMEHVSRLLGPQHYISLEMKYSLFNAILREAVSDISDENLQKVMRLSNDLLQVASLVDPGLSRFRGLLLLGKLKASAEQLLRLEIQQNTNVDVILNNVNNLNEAGNKTEIVSPKKNISYQAQVLLKEAKECEQILQYDHKVSEVAQMLDLLGRMAKTEES